MSDLVERLQSAIDAKEARARAAGGVEWFQGEQSTGWDAEADEEIRIPSGYVLDSQGGIVVYDEGSPTPSEAAHISDNDPSSVLRWCAVDREIVALHVKDVEQWAQGDDRELFDVAICRTCAYGESCDHCFDRRDLDLVEWPCARRCGCSPRATASPRTDDLCRPRTSPSRRSSPRSKL